MATLRYIALIPFAWCLPASAEEVTHWRTYVEEASSLFGVPVVWIEQVMRAESAGQTHLAGRPIVSSAGAMGLMQLMPRTWAEMRTRLGLGRDPHLPRDNILAGTAYLRLMYNQFGYPGLFGAYNAGPGRYAEYLAGSRSLPAETRAYMAATVASTPRASGAGAAPSIPAPVRAATATIFFDLADASQGPSLRSVSRDIFVAREWKRVSGEQLSETGGSGPDQH